MRLIISPFCCSSDSTPLLCARSISMKCSRLSWVVLAVAARCTAGFFVTGNHGLIAPAFRQCENTSRAPPGAPSQRGGGDTLTMGAAGKKRKKVRRDLAALRHAYGRNTTHCFIHHSHISPVPNTMSHGVISCRRLMSRTAYSCIYSYSFHVS